MSLTLVFEVATMTDSCECTFKNEVADERNFEMLRTTLTQCLAARDVLYRTSRGRGHVDGVRDGPTGRRARQTATRAPRRA